MAYVTVYLGMLGSLWSRGRPNNQSKTYLALWSAAMLLFIGMRRWVGCDYPSYLYNWVNSQYRDLSDLVREVEPGFALATYILQQLGLGFQALNLFAATIFMLGLVVFAIRQPDPLPVLVLSFPVLIIHLAMAATRQSIGLGFVIIAIACGIERKLLSFFVFTVTGGLFHYSAFIFLPLAGLLGRGRSSRVFLGGLVLWIAGIAYLSPEPVAQYNARYLDPTTIDPSTVAVGGIFRSFTLLIAGVTFLALLRRGWKRAYPEDYGLFRYFALGMILVLPVTLMSSVIADRLGYYLMPVQAAIFARIPFVYRGPYRAWLSAMPYVMLLVVLVAWLELSPLAEQCYLPYDNHLFGEDQRPGR